MPSPLPIQAGRTAANGTNAHCQSAGCAPASLARANCDSVCAVILDAVRRLLRECHCQRGIYVVVSER